MKFSENSVIKQVRFTQERESWEKVRIKYMNRGRAKVGIMLLEKVRTYMEKTISQVVDSV
jgi:hypothetical protein